MLDAIKNTLLATLGIVAISREKLEQLIDELIRKGELSRDQGKVLLDELLAKCQSEGQALSLRLTQDFSRLVEKTPLVTRREYEGLEERLRLLEIRLGPASRLEVEPLSGTQPSGAASQEDGPRSLP